MRSESDLRNVLLANHYNLDVYRAFEGGTSFVHMASSMRLRVSHEDHRVAIKEYKDHIMSDEKNRSRIQNEFETCKGLSHTGIVRILDFLESQSPNPLLVMRRVKGCTLSE